MEILELLTGNNIGLLLLYVAPGFISLKVWGLIQPSEKIKFSESLIEVVIFSIFNFIVTSWILVLVKDSNIVWLTYLVCFFTVIIIPIFWPILLRRVLSWRFLKRKILNQMPKSWDYFFIKQIPCFMLVHLKNGSIIGGLYDEASFASSYPEKEDIYLQEVWKINEQGEFVERVQNTMGLLINSDAIEFIELFEKRVEGETQ